MYRQIAVAAVLLIGVLHSQPRQDRIAGWPKMLWAGRRRLLDERRKAELDQHVGDGGVSLVGRVGVVGRKEVA